MNHATSPAWTKVEKRYLYRSSPPPPPPPYTPIVYHYYCDMIGSMWHFGGCFVPAGFSCGCDGLDWTGLGWAGLGLTSLRLA